MKVSLTLTIGAFKEGQLVSNKDVLARIDKNKCMSRSLWRVRDERFVLVC